MFGGSLTGTATMKMSEMSPHSRMYDIRHEASGGRKSPMSLGTKWRSHLRLVVVLAVLV